MFDQLGYFFTIFVAMKNIGLLIGILVIGVVACMVLSGISINLRRDLNVAINNEKAALAEADSLKNQSIAYQYTIDQLVNSNDSITMKLMAAKKELKIKDRKIKELAYLASQASKTDTIFVPDTIFRDKDFKLDTTIGDQWYKCTLGLEYPNKIAVSPEFKSEKSIIVSTRRETIYPEKKCWLARLFQKKHTLVEVNVVEESPYIETTESKFIQVIK